MGEYTYTTDQRFAARHNRDTGEWVLVVKYVQVYIASKIYVVGNQCVKLLFLNLKERDAGGYECQIPSATPRSYKVNLNIVGEEAMLASVSHELEAIVSVFVRRECVLCP